MRGMDWIEKLVSDWTEQEWVGMGAGLKGKALCLARADIKGTKWIKKLITHWSSN